MTSPHTRTRVNLISPKQESLPNIFIDDSLKVALFTFTQLSYESQAETFIQTDDENRFWHKMASHGHSRSNVLRSLKADKALHDAAY